MRHTATAPSDSAPAPTGVRPKAFRRPPAWVAPAPLTPASAAISSPRNASDAAQPAASTAMAMLPQATPHTSAVNPVRGHGREGMFSLFLLAIIIACNLLAAGLLELWHKPHSGSYALPNVASGGPFLDAPASNRAAAEYATRPKAPSVTLFATPLDTRRISRGSPIDRPIDRTDAIASPPANPDDDF